MKTENAKQYTQRIENAFNNGFDTADELHAAKDYDGIAQELHGADKRLCVPLDANGDWDVAAITEHTIEDMEMRAYYMGFDAGHAVNPEVPVK